MKAIRIHDFGGPESVSLEEIPTPQPSPGEARVRLCAMGLNYLDIYHRTGVYNLPRPFTGGMEGAGVVEAVGEGVTDLAPGDRVGWVMSIGAHAEQAVVPAWKLVPLPDGISFETAAAVMLQGITAQYLTHSTFPLQPGQRALVHAAAGGVGLLLLQMARSLGATVYATAGSAEKLRRVLEMGAAAAIPYREVDFADEVRGLTDGRGVDVVYDGVGKDTWEGSLRSLKVRGTLVFFGEASGPVPPIATGRLVAAGSVYMTRTTLNHHMLDRAELLARTADLFARVQDGSLQVQIDGVYPLDQIANAHLRLQSRQSSGKILLKP